MAPPLNAFIFDIDGTLVDSNQLHVESWDRAFRHFGKQFSHAELRAQIGKGFDQYLPEFLTADEAPRLHEFSLIGLHKPLADIGFANLIHALQPYQIKQKIRQIGVPGTFCFGFL